MFTKKSQLLHDKSGKPFTFPGEGLTGLAKANPVAALDTLEVTGVLQASNRMSLEGLLNPEGESCIYNTWDVEGGNFGWENFSQNLS